MATLAGSPPQHFDHLDDSEAVEVAVADRAILMRSSTFRAENVYGRDAFAEFVQCAKRGMFDDLL